MPRGIKNNISEKKSDKKTYTSPLRVVTPAFLHSIIHQCKLTNSAKLPSAAIKNIILKKFPDQIRSCSRPVIHEMFGQLRILLNVPIVNFKNKDLFNLLKSLKSDQLREILKDKYNKPFFDTKIDIENFPLGEIYNAIVSVKGKVCTQKGAHSLGTLTKTLELKFSSFHLSLKEFAEIPRDKFELYFKDLKFKTLSMINEQHLLNELKLRIETHSRIVSATTATSTSSLPVTSTTTSTTTYTNNVTPLEDQSPSPLPSHSSSDVKTRSPAFLGNSLLRVNNQHQLEVLTFSCLHAAALSVEENSPTVIIPVSLYSVSSIFSEKQRLIIPVEMLEGHLQKYNLTIDLLKLYNMAEAHNLFKVDYRKPLSQIGNGGQTISNIFTQNVLEKIKVFNEKITSFNSDVSRLAFK